LAKGDGCRFAPEELIDLWFEHCPVNSRSYLEGVIIKRAGNIIIGETDKACRMDALCVPTTKIEADDLDEEFLLPKLEGVYRETLPYLWLLLNTIVTSWNRSEKQKQEPSTCKESRARFVELLPQFCSTFQLSCLFMVGLCRHHKHPPFYKEPGYKCLPNTYGAIPRHIRCHKTRLGCVQPHRGVYQL
jgi:hypothetical protein